MSGRIYTIVPVFNRIHFTEPCLEQLKAQVCELPQTIIVVDDGSSDGTSGMIRSRFPDVELIEGVGDWYWTGSIYQGVAKALDLSDSDEDYVFVLNDDLTFGSDLLQKLVERAHENPRSIMQALGSWTNRRDEIHFAGFKINRWNGRHDEPHVGEKLSSFPDDYLFEVDSLTGRGVLFPIAVFREVGNYDLRIPHRGDLELPCRAANAGWKLLIYFGAVVYSYPNNRASNINEQDVYRLRDIPDYFFGILSSSHIPSLWWYSNTLGRSWFNRVVVFTCILIRHTGHFFKRLRSL